MTRTPHRLAAVCLLVIALTGVAACGGGKGGGGTDGGPDVGAFNFNQANMTTAAGVAARVVDAFPPVADLLDAAFVEIGRGGLRSSEPVLLPACAVGAAAFSWSDVNLDGVLSAGDTARFDLTGCRVHPGDGETLGGSMDLTFTSVASGPPRTLEAQLELKLAAAGNPPGALTGRVALSATSADGVHHGLVFRPSGAAKISATGAASFELGCYDVRDDPDPALGFVRRVAATGVVKTQGKILSIAPGGKLLYEAGDRPAGQEGRLELVSLAVPECAALGVGEGVGDSDGSRLEVITTGAPGELRLDLYRGSGPLERSVDARWWDLLNPAAQGIVNGTDVTDVASVAIWSLYLPRQVGALLLDLVAGQLTSTPVTLCTSGNYAFDRLPSVGNAARITFSACATDALGDPARLDGGATVTLTEVSGDPATGTYTLAARVDPLDVAAALGASVSRLTGAFRFARSAAGGGRSERADAVPGVALQLSESGGALGLTAFTVRSDSAASGAYTVASAGDVASLTVDGIAGALAVAVTSAIQGTEPEPPSAGEMKVTASDGTGVGVRPAPGGAVFLDLDADGDGVTDLTIPTTWAALD